MLRNTFLLLGAAGLVALPAHAQNRTRDGHDDRNDCPEVASPHVMRGFTFRMRDDNRAAIGIATSTGGTRDTLGVLVTEVTSDGPADKAGIEEGDRLQSVNGVDLRLAPADAGDREMRGLMARRLVRVFGKVKPGDQVALGVYADGKIRSVKVTTVKASELFRDDTMFGLSGDWLDGAKKVKLERLQDRFDYLSRPPSQWRYELPPADGFDMREPGGMERPPTAPLPPMTPMTPMAPGTAPVPPAAPTPPSMKDDAPRRIMRIDNVAPAPVPTVARSA